SAIQSTCSPKCSRFAATDCAVCITDPTMMRSADLALEFRLRGEGFRLIAGLDEAGRGAWAGPVVAGAVILPLDRFDLAHVLEGVTDSKQLTPEEREALLPRILDVA